jgi:hypothetical protein
MAVFNRQFMLFLPEANLVSAALHQGFLFVLFSVFTASVLLFSTLLSLVSLFRSLNLPSFSLSCFRSFFFFGKKVKLSRYRPGQALGVPAG